MLRGSPAVGQRWAAEPSLPGIYDYMIYIYIYIERERER